MALTGVVDKRLEAEEVAVVGGRQSVVHALDAQATVEEQALALKLDGQHGRRHGIRDVPATLDGGHVLAEQARQYLAQAFVIGRQRVALGAEVDELGPTFVPQGLASGEQGAILDVDREQVTESRQAGDGALPAEGAVGLDQAVAQVTKLEDGRPVGVTGVEDGTDDRAIGIEQNLVHGSLQVTLVVATP